ncbi:hypothetical protein C8J57DRAFT_1355190 [Mycena rebaudengoi]|nr:hypothetical protein C8J57DRAFT_1355190 [Mycena rebaudengoi]
MCFDITANVFLCPRLGCGHRMQLRLCQNGSRSGRYFVACFSDNHSTFWHFFPPGVSPPAAPSDSPTTWQAPPTAPSASAPPTSALPLTTTTLQIETSKPPSCRARKCNSTRITIKCKRRMCRRDCLASGGCPFHHPDDKPTHPPLPALSGSSLKALNNIITYVDSLPGPTEARRLVRLWEEQKHSSTSTLLATTSPSPSPSPLLPSPVSGSMLPSSSTSDLVFEPCSVLLFWPAHRASIVIQVIEDCPTWPRFRLDDIPLLLTMPEHPELDRYYQCYSFAYNRWMQVSTTYVHKLSSDRPLLIRRLGVVGIDEAEQLGYLGVSPRFHPAPPPPSPVRPFGKGKQCAIVIDDSSDDEVVIVKDSRIKSEHFSPPTSALAYRYRSLHLHQCPHWRRPQHRPRQLCGLPFRASRTPPALYPALGHLHHLVLSSRSHTCPKSDVSPSFPFLFIDLLHFRTVYSSSGSL